MLSYTSLPVLGLHLQHFEAGRCTQGDAPPHPPMPPQGTKRAVTVSAFYSRSLSTSNSLPQMPPSLILGLISRKRVCRR